MGISFLRRYSLSFQSPCPPFAKGDKLLARSQAPAWERDL